MRQIDLSTARRIHIVGIGGSGMSAIAGVLLAMGHEVTGSDAADSVVLQKLLSAGARVRIGHEADNVPQSAEIVGVSTAIPRDNPEIVAAEQRGLPVLRRAEVLASIAATRRTIGVAGAHGKTTTSTLLALVLEAGGVRPSWVIGGEVLGRGSGGHWDAGPYFVVEADESDGTFLGLGAESVIVTNTDPDHLENYGSLDDKEGAIRALRTAFAVFVAGAGESRVLCIDDEGCADMARLFGATTYGQGEGADYRIVDLELGRFDATFAVEHGGEVATRLHLPSPGVHNVLNATAALAMGHRLGVPLDVGAAGIASFGGVGRRFQRRGERNDITFVDDYAHLPSEVKAALAAARAGAWNRIVAVFQPHRYSRTAQVGCDFGGAFDDADVLILTDIYSAGEKPRPGIDGTVVRDAVEAEPGHPPVTYVEQRSILAGEIAKVLKPGDLCITLGAGDVTKLADEIMEVLA